jgi:N-sulfoglucosamine sulfohydrolase
MDRRKFLKFLGLGAVASALPARVPAAAVLARAERPNVFFVIADDMTWSDAGCYGNQDVKTPNIDKLAADGMRFSRCFTATAMCAPSRQQLYTGLYPVKNGAYPNHSRVKPGTKSIAHYLKDLGYRVGIAGKKHYAPLESYPFETVAATADDYAAIENFINRNKTQPYCLVVAYKQPHLPWNKGTPQDYDPKKLTLPPYMVDTIETRNGLAKYYAEITYLDAQIAKCMELVDQSGTRDNTVFVFTSEQGSAFTHCKWTLYDSGIRTAFIARWPKRIRAGSITDAMVQYVDVTPTLIKLASGQPIHGLDGFSFSPVLLGQKASHRDVTYGVHTTRGIHSGSDCYPVRSIRTAAHKYIMNLNHKVEFSNNVTERDTGSFWKSWVEKAKTDADAARKVKMYMRRPAEELYDLEKDPYELNNLAGDPKYRPLMDSLRKRLLSWMGQQGDKGIETEMQAFERQGRKESTAHRNMEKKKRENKSNKAVNN